MMKWRGKQTPGARRTSICSIRDGAAARAIACGLGATVAAGSASGAPLLQSANQQASIAPSPRGSSGQVMGAEDPGQTVSPAPTTGSRGAIPSSPNSGLASAADQGGISDAVAAGGNPQQTLGSLPVSSDVQSSSQRLPGEARLASAPVSYDASSSPNFDDNPDQLLALFQDGAGQSRRAMDELDLVIGQRQIFSDLRTLETRLNQMQRPTANVVVRHSTQSDDLDINQFEVSQDVYFAHGRNELRVGVQGLKYSAPGSQDVKQYAAGFAGNVRFSQITAVAGELWINQIGFGRRQTTLATYDLFVTLRPSDVIRIDIDTNRRTFDNIRSLQLGLTAQSYGGSIDFVPTDQLRVTGRFHGASYSDDNKRRSEELSVVWRARSTPIVELGLRGTNFHFTRLLNNGYFNPKDYFSGEAMFRFQSDLSKKLTVQLAGSGGFEHASPGGTKPLVKGSLQAAYKLLNGWSLDGEISHFTSRASSSSGFARTSVTLGLHYRF